LRPSNRSGIICIGFLDRGRVATAIFSVDYLLWLWTIVDLRAANSCIRFAAGWFLARE
jgi:hypothetical protein